MYSNEDRLDAIELYFKYGRKTAAVVREQGYPTANWRITFEFTEGMPT